MTVYWFNSVHQVGTFFKKLQLKRMNDKASSTATIQESRSVIEVFIFFDICKKYISLIFESLFSHISIRQSLSSYDEDIIIQLFESETQNMWI